MLAFEQYASAGVSMELQHAVTACREQQAAKHRLKSSMSRLSRRCFVLSATSTWFEISVPVRLVYCPPNGATSNERAKKK